MKLHFFKYQATGNDFVLIDNRTGNYRLDLQQIRQLCDRKFGVGADGLMLIERHPDVAFKLQYYNSDGSQSLCGNGSRAAVSLAASLGIVNGKASFEAYDGLHDADIATDGVIKLRMNDVKDVMHLEGDYFINTGSPHFVRFVTDLKTYPVVNEGRRIRNDSQFAPGGTNVNFVEKRTGNRIFVRTYERGVEDETLSCGTGVTAAALAASFEGLSSPVEVETPGGQLEVQFTKVKGADGSGQGGTFHDIYLRGPAKMVFEGDLDL